MKHDPIATGKRKSVNLSLDTGIVATARAVGINLSKVSERAIRDAIRDEQDRRWKEENRAWIIAFNEWYDRNGHPLAHLELP